MSCGVAPVLGLPTSLSLVSLVSGASSQFGLDVMGRSSISTEFLKSGAVPSLVSGQVAHHVCNHGHNAASTACLTVVPLRTCTQTSASKSAGHAAAKMFLGEV